MKTLFLLIFSLMTSSLYSQITIPPVELEAKHKDFLSWRFGVFFHFNMATFTDLDCKRQEDFSPKDEWATGYEDPLTFAPQKLDCDQWIREAKAAGATYAVLTVKHTGGWCLWDSKYTDTHDMTAMKNFKNGKGDIVHEFVDACHRYNMKVGFYYCLPGDYARQKGKKYNVLPADKADNHGLPPQAIGRYAEFMEWQLEELFTKYGKIDIVFADQYSNRYTFYAWTRLKNKIKSLQPQCIVVANNAHDYRYTDIIGYEHPWLKLVGKPALPPEGNIYATEVNDCITDGAVWFWHDASFVPKLQRAEDIVKKLRYCNANNANYLLNVQPDRDGLLSGNYLKTLREIGEINKKDGFCK